MPFDPHKNLAASTVATAPSPAASGLSLVVAAADGVKFGSLFSFNAIVWPVNSQPTTANAEIVRVSAIATDTFTIARQQEGTSARTIQVGDQIAMVVTGKTLTDLEAFFSPDLALTNMLLAADQTVLASTSAIVASDLEIGSGTVTEIAAGGLLEIT